MDKKQKATTARIKELKLPVAGVPDNARPFLQAMAKRLQVAYR